MPQSPCFPYKYIYRHLGDETRKKCKNSPHINQLAHNQEETAIRKHLTSLFTAVK